MQTQFFSILDSTQDEAKRQVQQHEFSQPAMIVAKAQSNGYGRFKRSFYSPENGLYLTIIMPEKDVTCTPTLLTHAVAVSLLSVLTDAGYQQIGIKWINDLYQNKQKVAGILTEQVVSGNRTYYLIGIGLNLNKQMIPTKLIGKMGTLTTTQFGFIEPKALLPNIAETLISVAKFKDEHILSHYRQASILIGREIEAEIGNDRVSGCVVGINSIGGLIVETSTCNLDIDTGEVTRIYFEHKE